MPDTVLRADNYAEWDPHWFARQDGARDERFYQAPRKVVHIDEAAIAATTQLYSELLPAGGTLLDLMSAWRSHLPPEVRYARVAGLGMNADEMAENAQLTEFVVHNLNAQAALPFADGEFDGACCTVSVQYLQRPVEVLRDVARVLKPDAPLVMTFSNRCFPTKAINIWRELDDEGHAQLVALYFQAAGGWRDITMQDRSADCAPSYQCDPLFAVWAYAGRAAQ
jgi:SAM-dependent methyltransferase